MSKVGYKALVEAAEAKIRTNSAIEAVAQDMGLRTCHIDGGFEAWKAAGGEVTHGKK